MGIKQLDARHEKIDQLREKARARVERDTVLRKHCHFLVDSPHFLLDPTLFIRLPRDRDEMDLCWARLERHYCWVCSAYRGEILRWTVDRISKFRDYLKDYIDNRRHEIESYFPYATETWQWLLLQDILDLILSGEKALRRGQIVEATNFMAQAFVQAGRCTWLWSIMKQQELTSEIGKKVKKGGEKGHIRTYGTREEKLKRWAEYQKFADEWHQRHPDDLYWKIAAKTAKHFNKSTKTIKRRIKNPLKR